jgi:hypothetical protein
LRRGSILVDERDLGDTPKVLFYLEHSIQDASLTRSGDRRTISKRMLHVEVTPEGQCRHIQYAPYLDYRPLHSQEPSVDKILQHPSLSWITKDLEKTALSHAISKVVPGHLDEVKKPRLELIAKTEAAVKERLTKEIAYWDHRSQMLKDQEKSGKTNAKVNSGEARKRADNLQGRLEKRLQELKLEAQIAPLPPVLMGGTLVVPAGLMKKISGNESESPAFAVDTQASAARARAVIMQIERDLGFEPIDRELDKLGYDIESRVPDSGKLRFIEVKGRISGAATITVTRNEILYSLNKPEDFILAIVEFLDESTHRVHYVRQPFKREPDFSASSVNYDFADLIALANPPS